MAEHSVDRLLRTNPELKAKAEQCVSEQVKLFGAHGWSDAMISKLIRAGINKDIADHLSRNYGDKALTVAKIANEEGFGSRY